MRLTRFELRKIWSKKSFALSVCVLLTVNVFLLWYVNLPDEETPPLSAYHAFQADTAAMSEAQKADYVTELKEKLDGISFVQNIQNMQAMDSEMGKTLAQQELEKNPGVFEKYYAVLQSGDYLNYTENLSQESTLLNELYEEFSKVSGYQKYLDSVQESKNRLNGISIFQNAASNSFSGRNIEKSATDYESLRSVPIRWQPSKGIALATGSRITDILLFLGVLLFVGGLIIEEKEKGLFYITRITKHGQTTSLLSKLAALLIHCVTVTVLLIGSNLIFAMLTTGVGDVTTSIQSLAPYMESSLSISVLEYLLLSVITKSVVLFGFGALLTAVAIYSKKGYSSYFAGIAFLGISGILSIVIPAYSALSPLKYLNFLGMMETEQLYGSYLNLNIGGYPFSRLALSWTVLAAVAIVSIIMCRYTFLQGRNLDLKKTHLSSPIQFHPHGNLLRFEAYKLLITNRSALILLCFAVLIGYQSLAQEYHPSVQEAYYQKMMLQLEGVLNKQKENRILSEQARFEEANTKIAQIDEMAENGELDRQTADTMKLEWESVLSFYPSFQRIEKQYNRIKQSGGTFVYDTGYLYLFGNQNNSFLIEVLFLSLCMVFAFHNGISMEYTKKSWFLIRTTKCGCKKIIERKIIVCLIGASVMTVLTWIFRSIHISETFPMNGLFYSIQSIPAFQNFGINIPILCFIGFVLLSQMIAVMLIVLIVLGISFWRKNDMQALFFSLLILAVPLILKLMGFDFAGWFSIYPFYSWTAKPLDVSKLLFPFTSFE